MTTLSDTLAELIDIPSVTGDEARICDHVSKRLAANAPHLSQHRVNNSLVVSTSGDGPLVVLAGHLDTVPPQGQPPARIDTGRMYGLGATDMKGGVAVMLHLMEEVDSTWPYRLAAVFYEAEEGKFANNGLEPVLNECEWLASASFGVLLEPSDGEIQAGCNGVMNAKVTFTGKSSHSARPWWGENAISKAGAWLSKMHPRRPAPVDIDGLVFKEVMSVTLARGGLAANIIPPRFELNLNYRFGPHRTVAEAEVELRKACRDADEVEIVDAAPSGGVVTDHPLVAELVGAAGVGIGPKQGWTDVARLGARGIPSINFGPGETSEAHTANESMPLGHLPLVFNSLREVFSGSS
ncbi:MAG: succinyl-diaminopimelate desuccinylase [bacterium]|nr:succinyl-diaminopimelate desuccinylase [Acidimicrobiia bacterium]MCY4648841.1 succinyl-diaminopimelate desuccinylase [bacterium]